MQQTDQRDRAALRIMFELDDPFVHRKLFEVERIKGNDIGTLAAREMISYRIREAACAYMMTRLQVIT